MKFLNKKEQVFDIQLTPYGKHKLSAGELKPTYYAFFDDNILYDAEYAGVSENQNETHGRVKQDTQYLESQTIFRQVLSGAVVRGGILQETIYEQDENLFTSEGFIGDAKLFSTDTDVAPAWKFISLINNITSSALQDERNKFKIAQINITASYVLESVDLENLNLRQDDVRAVGSRTSVFSDGRVIQLESNDPLIYLEELNTELLTENFDIEVFHVTRPGPDDTDEDDFRRLYFQSIEPQIVDGMIVSASPATPNTDLTTGSVEYYFSIGRDQEVEPSVVCKYINQFNTENYLVDLDFNCSDVDGEDVYFDIYGRVTESEICPD
tara:strand:- start:133 stop:1107 length:975 start_codon:yes stop_codon:yes gene_type:complete